MVSRAASKTRYRGARRISSVIELPAIPVQDRLGGEQTGQRGDIGPRAVSLEQLRDRRDLAKEALDLGIEPRPVVVGCEGAGELEHLHVLDLGGVEETGLVAQVVDRDPRQGVVLGREEGIRPDREHLSGEARLAGWHHPSSESSVARDSPHWGLRVSDIQPRVWEPRGFIDEQVHDDRASLLRLVDLGLRRRIEGEERRELRVSQRRDDVPRVVGRSVGQLHRDAVLPHLQGLELDAEAELATLRLDATSEGVDDLPRAACRVEPPLATEVLHRGSTGDARHPRGLDRGDVERHRSVSPLDSTELLLVSLAQHLAEHLAPRLVPELLLVLRGACERLRQSTRHEIGGACGQQVRGDAASQASIHTGALDDPSPIEHPHPVWVFDVVRTEQIAPELNDLR